MPDFKYLLIAAFLGQQPKLRIVLRSGDGTDVEKAICAAKNKVVRDIAFVDRSGDHGSDGREEDTGDHDLKAHGAAHDGVPW